MSATVEFEHQRIMIDDYFDIIVQNKASDLHMQEGQPPKMRLHGDITKLRDEVLTHAEMEQMLREVAGPKRWEMSPALSHPCSWRELICRILNTSWRL